MGIIIHLHAYSLKESVKFGEKLLHIVRKKWGTQWCQQALINQKDMM